MQRRSFHISLHWQRMQGSWTPAAKGKALVLSVSPNTAGRHERIVGELSSYIIFPMAHVRHLYTFADQLLHRVLIMVRACRTFPCSVRMKVHSLAFRFSVSRMQDLGYNRGKKQRSKDVIQRQEPCDELCPTMFAEMIQKSTECKDKIKNDSKIEKKTTTEFGTFCVFCEKWSSCLFYARVEVNFFCVSPSE